jgi:hypothetical protein
MIIDRRPHQDSNIAYPSDTRNDHAIVVTEDHRILYQYASARRSLEIDARSGEVPDRAFLNGDFGVADNIDTVGTLSEPVDVEPLEQDLGVRWSIDDDGIAPPPRARRRSRWRGN